MGVGVMEERRKNIRLKLQSKLIIKRLDKDDTNDVSIEILDVSKGGIGFSCKEALTIGAVYESYLTIWTKEVIHAFLQIVRIEMNSNGLFVYGASFVGMPELEASRIDVYQKFNEE